MLIFVCYFTQNNSIANPTPSLSFQVLATCQMINGHLRKYKYILTLPSRQRTCDIHSLGEVGQSKPLVHWTDVRHTVSRINNNSCTSIIQSKQYLMPDGASGGGGACVKEKPVSSVYRTQQSNRESRKSRYPSNRETQSRPVRYSFSSNFFYGWGGGCLIIQKRSLLQSYQ